MVFSSLTFLYFFLPIVFALYFISKNRKWRNFILLIFSLLFYSWGEPRFVFIMAASTFAAWILGLCIDKYSDAPKIKRVFLISSLFILIGILFVFKYLNFFFDSLHSFTGIFFELPRIALPIGISFYTFQILSYIIDLYRGKVNVQRNFFRFLLYVCFFPQLIAGPIVRYITVENEISLRHESLDDAIYGIRRFIIGLAKKILIANNVALIAETIYGSSELAGSLALWLAAVCFGLQLYYDFSGYSDMAIGLGRIFGFHFLENFDYPFTALSITEYWRKWHISLSSWFRDYVYIPLGGNRVSTLRWIFNILVVWSLTGLWHGASWNFVFWGLHYCMLLIIEKLFLRKLLEKTPALFQHIYTLFFVCIGMTFFTVTDSAYLLEVLKELFMFTPSDWTGLLLLDTSICSKLIFIPFGLIFSFPVYRRINIDENRFIPALMVNGVYIALFAVSVMYIISSSYNPFIYFRF